MALPTAAARGREVRQRLVRTAAELIAERGWTAVSTRLLAQRAGVAPGLVHYHFASLQALLAEAALGVMRDLVAGLDQLLGSAQTPEDAVDLMLQSLDRYDGRDPTSLLFTETYLAATRDKGLRQAVSTLSTDFCRQLARWLGERGVATPEDTAAVLTAAIDGVMLHRALNPGLTSRTVAPVLRRILTSAATEHSTHGKAGEDR